MRVVTTVQVDAPLEKVWPVLDEDENLKLWMPDVIETTYPDGKPEGDPVGTRFVEPRHGSFSTGTTRQSMKGIMATGPGIAISGSASPRASEIRSS